MSESAGLPPMITNAETKVLLARNGFSQAQKGTTAKINQFAETLLQNALKQSMIQADCQGKSGLTKEMAQRSIDHTTGFPKGSY